MEIGYEPHEEFELEPEYIDLAVIVFEDPSRVDIFDLLKRKGYLIKVKMAGAIATWYTKNFKVYKDPSAAEIEKALKNPLPFTTILDLADNMLKLNDLAAHYATIIADTAYTGFDPRIMAGILYGMHKETKDYEEEQNQPFYVDMVFLIMLFLQRGTSVIDPSKLTTLPEETREKVAGLRVKYAIASKIGKKNKVKAVTLSRIAACFPTVVCKIMFEANITRPVSADTMAAIYPGFPKFLRNSCWFSIFWKGGKHTGIIKALLHYQVAEGAVINQKNAEYRGRTSEEKMEDAIRYAAAAFSSEMLDIPARKKLCRDYLNDINKATMKAWSDKFDEIFPEAAENVAQFFDQTE